MYSRSRRVGALVVAVALVAPLGAVLLPPSAVANDGRPTAVTGTCSAGSHTLGPDGSHLYPETGDGGYRSLHTDLYLVYDATTNRFLPGNHVVLTDRATQCLTSLTLDFERTTENKTAGPDMTVQAVTVDGVAARFRFVQPTYPGDPNGWNDPNPAAHEVSQSDPVGGPAHNPLPPACSPELLKTNSSKQDSQDGDQCPADKLLITPVAPIRDGSVFRLAVYYTGRPGVHNDGDGTTEGWFRAPDGGFVTTEPVGSEDWMPLNDYPAAKPTYDFYDTVNTGKTAISNGILVSVHAHSPDKAFPGGSETWHWHSAAPIASYLVEASVGNFSLTQRTADNGVVFYEAQDKSIPAAKQAKNLSIMNQQEDITEFESQFNGTYPFTSDGIVIGTPAASFEEEMQTMITFADGKIWLSVLYHENMHQWWGDNVSEANYRFTFFKEGLATLAQELLVASEAENAAGGPSSRKGQAAFQKSLVSQFDNIYASKERFWANSPSDPTPYELFSNAATYLRPSAAYIALRQILGPMNFTLALRQMQLDYGGGSITESQLEAAFQKWMPEKTPQCSARLARFFTEWFDTPYPSNGADEPGLTGPGLDGGGFYGGSCPS